MTQIEQLCNRGLTLLQMASVLNLKKLEVKKLLLQNNLWQSYLETQRLNAQINNLIEVGKTPEQIALILNMNLQMLKNKIHNIQQNNLIKMKKVKTWSKWSEEQLNSLKQMKKDGKSFPEIAKVIGKTHAATQKKASKLGLKNPIKFINPVEIKAPVVKQKVVKQNVKMIEPNSFDVEKIVREVLNSGRKAVIVL